ncbi:MAG: T9SS type A sorting domain-containing protein [Candidatus Komeilibacteria bacterium]|nr:T9SS type A sorting domain-containing protein [Candidatus Komeilibacteria bacterium]
MLVHVFAMLCLMLTVSLAQPQMMVATPYGVKMGDSELMPNSSPVRGDMDSSLMLEFIDQVPLDDSAYNFNKILSYTQAFKAVIEYGPYFRLWVKDGEEWQIRMSDHVSGALSFLMCFYRNGSIYSLWADVGGDSWVVRILRSDDYGFNWDESIFHVPIDWNYWCKFTPIINQDDCGVLYSRFSHYITGAGDYYSAYHDRNGATSLPSYAVHSVSDYFTTSAPITMFATDSTEMTYKIQFDQTFKEECFISSYTFIDPPIFEASPLMRTATSVYQNGCLLDNPLHQIGGEYTYGMLSRNDLILILFWDSQNSRLMLTVCDKKFNRIRTYNSPGLDFHINDQNEILLQEGKFIYSVREETISNVSDPASRQFWVSNHPNPFNPSTTIKYSLTEDVHVSLVVFDILGQEVKTLVNTVQGAGEYAVTFMAGSINSGAYIYKITAGDQTAVKKMLLTK